MNFYLRYRRSYLGYFWGLLNPVFMFSAIVFVFSSLLHKDFYDLLLVVFAGMIPWLLISQSIFSSCNAYISSEVLIRKVKFNHVLLPISNFGVVLLDNLVMCFIYLLVIIFKNNTFHYSYFQLVPAYFLVIIFGIGVSIIFSTLTVYFRDMQWIAQMIMQALFFMTPILYKTESLDASAQFLVQLNPLTPFVKVFVDILSDQIVDFNTWSSTFLIACFIALLGLSFYLYNRNKISLRL